LGDNVSKYYLSALRKSWPLVGLKTSINMIRFISTLFLYYNTYTSYNSKLG